MTSRAYSIVPGVSRDVWLPQQRHGAAVVRVQTGDVLLEDEPNSGGVGGLPAGVGDAIPWDADRPLTITAAGGTVASVLVVDNTNPVQPGAVSIAREISVAGVPAIDRPATLLAATSATAAAFGGSWTSDVLPVDSYATVLVTVSVAPNNLQVTAAAALLELRWTDDDGAVITTDRIALWLAPRLPIGGGFYAPGGAQTWLIRSPSLGSGLQLDVTTAATVATQPVTVTASVVASYRAADRAVSVVTATGTRWKGPTEVATIQVADHRGSLSPSVSIGTKTLVAATSWREPITPAWPGRRLTLYVEADSTLSADVPLFVWGLDQDTAEVYSLASVTLTSGASRWTFTIDTPADTAVGFSLPAQAAIVGKAVTIATSWSDVPVGLPGAITSS